MIATTFAKVSAGKADMCNHLAIRQNGHYNFTPGVGVARNMAGEDIHIVHNLGFLFGRSGSANPSPNPNALTRNVALERPED
jgi:hypothetical protein